MPSKRRCNKLWAPDHKMGQDKVKAMKYRSLERN